MKGFYVCDRLRESAVNSNISVISACSSKAGERKMPEARTPDTLNLPRSNKMRKIVITNKENHQETIKYWKGKTPDERLSAVELLREQYYIIQGYVSLPRIVRVINLIDREHENPSRL